MAEVEVVAAYGDPDNAGSCEIAVPNVQPGDWLVAALGSIYTEPSTTQVHIDRSGTWVEIGSPLGRPGNPNFQNYGLRTWRLTAVDPGTHTITTSGPDNETCLGVLHLRGCDSLDGAPVDVVVAQNDSNGQVPLGSLTTTVDNCLLVAVYGLVQFTGGSHGWTPPSGMTERVDVVTSPNPWNLLGISTQVIATAGSSGSKTAVSTVTTAFGEAGRMFAIRPVEEPEPPAGPEPGRMLLAYP